MKIQIDDDLAAKYQRWADDSKQPLQQVVERQLARFVDFPSTVRVIPLARDPLQQIEGLLGGGQIQSAEQLVARVRQHAVVTLGKVDLEFSPAQKAEITHRAQKRGVSPDVVIQELVAIILDQAFDAVTPYR